MSIAELLKFLSNCILNGRFAWGKQEQNRKGPLVIPGKIVVGTDFRAEADRAIDRALELAKEWGSEVVLVHALDPALGDPPTRGELDKRMRSVLPDSDIEVTFRYPIERADYAIASVAKEEGASLIVLGEARFNSIKDFLLGTRASGAPLTSYCEAFRSILSSSRIPSSAQWRENRSLRFVGIEGAHASLLKISMPDTVLRGHRCLQDGCLTYSSDCRVMI